MKSILVVEDVELNRDLLTQLLQDDYALAFAGDGLAAVELAARSRPDLVLMDLSLPTLDGYEATRRLKSDAATAAIPVIVLSAHAMKADEERARGAGCDDFLTKPIDEDRLFAAIARQLER
jgi:CheY-like chemotaxis protein